MLLGLKDQDKDVPLTVEIEFGVICALMADFTSSMDWILNFLLSYHEFFKSPFKAVYQKKKINEANSCCFSEVIHYKIHLHVQHG